MPLALFSGASPIELFNQNVDVDTLKIEFKNEIKTGVSRRPLLNKGCLHKAEVC